MPNPLISDIANLRLTAGTGLFASLDDTQLAPFYEVVYQKYIAKAFGDPFLQIICNDTFVNALHPTTKPRFLSLRANIKLAMAYYIHFEYASFGLGRNGPNGISENKTETTDPIRKWVFDERKIKSIEMAATLLEVCLIDVINNPSIFPAEVTITAYKQYFNQNGAELQDSCPATGATYRLWYTLRPFIKKTQRNILGPAIGTLMLNSVLARRATNTSTAADIAVMPYLREAEGYHAYLSALATLIIRQGDDGSLRVHTEFDGTSHADQPKPEQIAALKASIQSEAEASLIRLANFLNANILQYPDYANSTAYKVHDGLPGFMKNTAKKTVFRIR